MESITSIKSQLREMCIEELEKWIQDNKHKAGCLTELIEYAQKQIDQQ